MLGMQNICNGEEKKERNISPTKQIRSKTIDKQNSEVQRSCNYTKQMIYREQAIQAVRVYEGTCFDSYGLRIDSISWQELEDVKCEVCDLTQNSAQDR